MDWDLALVLEWTTIPSGVLAWSRCCSCAQRSPSLCDIWRLKLTRMCSGLLNRVCLGRIRVAPTVATLAVVLGCCLVGRRRCCWRDGGFSGQPWDSHRKNLEKKEEDDIKSQKREKSILRRPDKNAPLQL
uniref:Uncharacterized protein n=1 Tax=Hippocampus comes TaxID=109280 RepID=A0A3Q2ZJB5_HIPCM